MLEWLQVRVPVSWARDDGLGGPGDWPYSLYVFSYTDRHLQTSLAQAAVAGYGLAWYGGAGPEELRDFVTRPFKPEPVSINRGAGSG